MPQIHVFPDRADAPGPGRSFDGRVAVYGVDCGRTVDGLHR